MEEHTERKAIKEEEKIVVRSLDIFFSFFSNIFLSLDAI
jgi:hypothetical protein